MDQVFTESTSYFEPRLAHTDVAEGQFEEMETSLQADTTDRAIPKPPDLPVVGGHRGRLITDGTVGQLIVFVTYIIGSSSAGSQGTP